MTHSIPIVGGTGRGRIRNILRRERLERERNMARKALKTAATKEKMQSVMASKINKEAQRKELEAKMSASKGQGTVTAGTQQANTQPSDPLELQAYKATIEELTGSTLKEEDIKSLQKHIGDRKQAGGTSNQDRGKKNHIKN